MVIRAILKNRGRNRGRNQNKRGLNRAILDCLFRDRGHIIPFVLGDYRGNSFKGRPTRGGIYVLTGVIPTPSQPHKNDFPVLLA